jgi:hypothetical protein
MISLAVASTVERKGQRTKPYKVSPDSRKGLIRTCRRASILCLAALVLAAASTVLPWYVMGYDPSPVFYLCMDPGMCPPLTSTHFYLFGECYVANPGYAWDVGSVTSCIGFPGEPHTGELYAATAGLATCGLVLGAVVAGLGLQLTLNRRPMKVAIARFVPFLAIAAGVLLLAAPLVLMVGQPYTFTMDSVTFGCSPAGPAQSFWSACGNNEWGPDLGWFFSVGAGIALIIGGLLFDWFGKTLLRYGQVVETEGSDKKSPPRLVDFPPDVT